MANSISIIAHECIRQINRLDSVTNNIANVDTPGFKAEELYFLRGDSEGASGESKLRQIMVTNYSPGVMQKTDNVLDLAIQGEGFFVIQTKNGLAYTRDGRFTLNKDKQLVTQDGSCVLGRSGEIVITEGNIQIGENGVINVDGDEVDTLKIVDFRNLSVLRKLGRGLYQDPDGSAEPSIRKNPEIQSGYLELSNVQAIREMVEMINIQRSVESYQKVMQTIQDQDQLSANRVGKL
ncbi:MAG: flagellar basal-body rod protein FlgF [Deltaproteobacteria bacterium]|nr:flagellar basal-body rod protein FlgF [Deltaproteobacteria bacterium]MBW1718216.1 flagellar basal-body rod protein FlgF [Deltaproteobacteria bacterium]